MPAAANMFTGSSQVSFSVLLFKKIVDLFIEKEHLLSGKE